ncbi:hypothetical protein HN51_008979 [Arachis hypogaea]|uniref:CASP-like protein n=2 Tax=Arachis TaxID=3817 RepID=A0A445D1K0_ARAHY|nr:CASP-like protein 4D1 [Arachis duranensis]XP_025697615.1 CASP-like protein 4D1 [Arachis hypogaea]QHO43372.1 CASP-like protein [Arachis hypogaea]RYR56944.1 hypothetical protein Ahy_A05g022681 [Arachis hypogaea]
MVTRSAAGSVMLGLRILTLAASVATVIVISTNNVKFFDGSKLKFQDIHSFRYVLAVAVIAAVYCIVQLPFAIHYAVKQKRAISGELLKEFDFFADKVISVVVATGVAVGFAVSIEFKDFFDDIFDAAGVPKKDPTRTTNDKFYNRAIIASSVLSVAFVSIFVVSVLSSIVRSNAK